MSLINSNFPYSSSLEDVKKGPINFMKGGNGEASSQSYSAGNQVNTQDLKKESIHPNITYCESY